MAKNKIVYGGNTLIDLTGDTVTASSLLTGYTAHDRSGAVITGTAPADGYVWQDENGFIHLSDEGSGGDGGLEYEEGTWTPTEDVADAWIDFSNTHTSAPFFYIVTDATNTYDGTTFSNYGVRYINWESAFGSSFSVTSSGLYYYGIYGIMYRGNSNTSINTSGDFITNPLSNTNNTNQSFPKFWATASRIRAYTISNSRYWRAGRTYKWIAVWKPTT